MGRRSVKHPYKIVIASAWQKVQGEPVRAFFAIDKQVACDLRQGLEGYVIAYKLKVEVVFVSQYNLGTGVSSKRSTVDRPMARLTVPIFGSVQVKGFDLCVGESRQKQH